MIGKTIIGGRSFKGLVNYLISKVETGNGEILESRGVRDFDRRALIRDFVSRTSVNPSLSRCVWHTCLSFQDNLDSVQMLAIAHEWTKGMGLDKTQYVIVRHTDTKHPHFHIIANRINDDGRTVSDHRNWRRSELLCKDIVKRFNLTPVPDRRDEQRINIDNLHGRDRLKSDVNNLINPVLALSKSFDEFSMLMKQHGINCTVKYNPDGSIRGVRFERDDIRIKASEIHKSLSARNLASIIELNNANSSHQQKTKDEPGNRIAPIKSGKLSRSLDTSEEDEKKRKRRNDLDFGM